MSSFEVEIAGQSTVEAAVPLLLAQMKEHGNDIDAAVFARSVRGLVEVRNRGAVLLARSAREREVVGVAVLAHTWTIERGGLCSWLDELYVVPERRGDGVGTALLRRAIEVARLEGAVAVELEVDADHLRAEGLYRREGFEPLARRRWAMKLN